jgi:hypothetical protein
MGRGRAGCSHKLPSDSPSAAGTCLGVGGEARVGNAGDHRVSLKKPGDGGSVSLVGGHAQMQGLEPAQCEVTVERGRDGAEAVLDEAQALGEVVAVRDEHPALSETRRVRVSCSKHKKKARHDGATIRGWLREARGGYPTKKNENRQHLHTHFLHTHTTTSLCPLRYLVTECMTRSAPSLSGF